MLPLLQLCDSLLPIGGFAYSDGLEAANDQLRVDTTGEGDCIGLLRDWLAVSLDETIGHLEGPAVWHAYQAIDTGEWSRVVDLDAQLTALRPSASLRRSSRTMGSRLLTTWQTMRPHPRCAHLLELAKARAIGPTLPIAFAAACVSNGIERRVAVESYAYTRLAATISAAMRLMPIGQAAAHAALAGVLDRVPGVIDAAVRRDAALTSFTPMMDIAAMTQQYLHSRLFRS
jgi:urease accessory protein